MSMLANIIKLVNVFAHTKAVSKMLAISLLFILNVKKYYRTAITSMLKMKACKKYGSTKTIPSLFS